MNRVTENFKVLKAIITDLAIFKRSLASDGDKEEFIKLDKLHWDLVSIAFFVLDYEIKALKNTLCDLGNFSEYISKDRFDELVEKIKE